MRILRYRRGRSRRMHSFARNWRRGTDNGGPTHQMGKKILRLPIRQNGLRRAPNPPLEFRGFQHPGVRSPAQYPQYPTLETECQPGTLFSPVVIAHDRPLSGKRRIVENGGELRIISPSLGPVHFLAHVIHFQTALGTSVREPRIDLLLDLRPQLPVVDLDPAGLSTLRLLQFGPNISDAWRLSSALREPSPAEIDPPTPHERRG